MGRFGVRGADYAPPINDYSSGSSFSIQTEGYTFRFDSNFDEWATFTKEMKVLRVQGRKGLTIEEVSM